MVLPGGRLPIPEPKKEAVLRSKNERNYDLVGEIMALIELHLDGPIDIRQVLNEVDIMTRIWSIKRATTFTSAAAFLGIKRTSFIQFLEDRGFNGEARRKLLGQELGINSLPANHQQEYHQLKKCGQCHHKI